jgi:hypothetical protein
VLAPSRAEQRAAELLAEATAELDPNKPKSRSGDKAKPKTLLGSIANTLGKAGEERKPDPKKQTEDQQKTRGKQGKLPL